MLSNKQFIDLYLVEPRGFCAGVERAIAIVENAIDKFGAPIYVRHEIVHNKYVVEKLKEKGAIFVAEIDEIPLGAIVVFSAHGVSKKVEDNALSQDLHILDATCPLVTKVHLEAQSHEKKERQIILIGHKGHPEVEGTSGRVKEKVTLVSTIEDVNNLKFTQDDNLAYVTQTTLSVDDTRIIIEALKIKYPNVYGPDLRNICYATQNRQNAVKELTKHVELVLVLGAANSSNSNRLKDIAFEMGKASYLINSYLDIKQEWLHKIKKIGITAGASAPEELVKQVIKFLQDNFEVKIHNLQTIEENIHFNLPIELRSLKK